MKTFKEIYEEIVKNNGCNTGETFAKSMFEAGQKSGINEYLKGITSWEDCFQLAQFLLIKMTREGIDMNASELVLSVEMNHENSRYKSRMAIQYTRNITAAKMGRPSHRLVTILSILSEADS